MTETSKLELMRAPFEAHHISKLPKPTKAQTDEVKADYKKGVNCAICGKWHHPKVVHLDYVGHAALTDRLLNVDLQWFWEPVAFDADGLPKLDKDGGMWIKLTVLGVTRFGYGDAQGKTGGDAMKERIGDALRNAAMRFGAALDLWHKGELHSSKDDGVEGKDEGAGSKGGSKGLKEIAPWTKKDLASVILSMQTTSELDDFMARNTTQIAVDLSDDENKSFLKWFDGQRSAIAKTEAIGDAK